MSNLVPRSFWGRTLLPSFFDDEGFESDFFSTNLSSPSGLSVSEDDTHVFVDAQVPGVPKDKIDVSIEKGVLWIRGQQEDSDEDKQRKYYRRSSSSFSYQLTVPGNIDESLDPEAVYKNGVMHITFKKAVTSGPKKIAVREE